MSENKISLVNAIGRVLIAIFTIFSKCRCASTCCKSSCVVGEEEMEHEDIEIHRSRTPQPSPKIQRANINIIEEEDVPELVKINDQKGGLTIVEI